MRRLKEMKNMEYNIEKYESFKAGAEWMAEKAKQEQPESDIEKEIDEYIEKEFGERWDGCVPVSCFDLVMMANHFYERGMSVMRERIANPDYNQKVVEKIKSEYPMDESNARKEE